MQGWLQGASTPQARLKVTTGVLLGVEAVYGYLLEFSMLVLLYRGLLVVYWSSLRLAPLQQLAVWVAVANAPVAVYHLVAGGGDPGDALVLNFIGPLGPASRPALLLVDAVTAVLHYVFVLSVMHAKAQAALGSAALRRPAPPRPRPARTRHTVWDLEEGAAPAPTPFGFPLPPGASAAAAQAAVAAGVFDGDDSSGASAGASDAQHADAAALVSESGLTFAGNAIM